MHNMTNGLPCGRLDGHKGQHTSVAALERKNESNRHNEERKRRASGMLVFGSDEYRVQRRALGARALKDETGQTYGRLTVLEVVGRGRDREALWLCLCECGNQTTVRGVTLRRGETRSCGCLHRESMRRLGLARLGKPGKKGADNPHWVGDGVHYLGLHQRIRTVRGRASDYPCVDCGRAARHWSLSWRRVPPEKLRADVGGIAAGCPYSLGIDDYDSRCVSCARKYDVDFVRDVVLPAEQAA